MLVELMEFCEVTSTELHIENFGVQDSVRGVFGAHVASGGPAAGGRLLSCCPRGRSTASRAHSPPCPSATGPRSSRREGSVLPLLQLKASSFGAATRGKFCENMLQPYLRILLVVVVDM